jgi:hypothetical protein
MNSGFFCPDEGEISLLAMCRGVVGGVNSMKRLNTVNQLPDATLKFIALNSCGRPVAFVHWSNELFPDAALVSCSSSTFARDNLGEKLGELIAMPVLQGEVLSRSFSIYPMLYSPSGRLSSKLAYLLASKTVASWLREIALKTVRPLSEHEMDALVLHPLNYIAGLQLIPAQYNLLAAEGLALVGDYSWRPRVVFSHNDFWVGNVMFSSAAKWPGVPQVIDWGASSVSGIPFFDSIRYVKSARLPSGILRYMIKQQLIATQSSPRSGLFNLVAGLGRLGLNRDRFPEARFAQLAVDTVEAYKEAVLNLPEGEIL